MRTKLLITLASPFAGLLLAELGVRWLDRAPAAPPEVRGVLFRPSLVPGLTFENRPGAVRTIEYRDRPDAEPTVVVHRVNAQGLRGPVVDGPPGSGTLRIACLGDSHTFGAGVGEGRAWPAVLRDLAAEDPGRFGAGVERVEVLNFGVNAYDTRREVLLLEERALPLEPDVVLLQYHVNDVHARNALGWKPAYDDWLWRLSDPDRGGVLGRLRELSRALDVVLDRLHGARAARDEAGLSLEGYGVEDEGWRRVTGALRDARDLLEARDTAFAVVLFPSLLEAGDGTLSSHRALRRVADFCRDEGIAVLDAERALLDAARGRPIAELRVHPHDPHAGEEAHAAFARAVLDGLFPMDRGGRRPLPPPER